MAAARGGFGGGDPEPDPYDLERVDPGPGPTSGPAAPIVPLNTGLAETLRPYGKRLVIGVFAQDRHEVARSLQLRRLSDADMENEPCIGSYRWEVTVRPLSGARERAGAVWRAGYFPSGPECR